MPSSPPSANTSFDAPMDELDPKASGSKDDVWAGLGLLEPVSTQSSSDGDADSEAGNGRTERLLNEKLLNGYWMVEATCPSCQTPLVKKLDSENVPDADAAKDSTQEDPPKDAGSPVSPSLLVSSQSFDQPFLPVGGVPYCVACDAHVVTSTNDLKILEDCESLRVKGSILSAMRHDESLMGTLKEEEQEEEEQEEVEQKEDATPENSAEEATDVPHDEGMVEAKEEQKVENEDGTKEADWVKVDEPEDDKEAVDPVAAKEEETAEATSTVLKAPSADAPMARSFCACGSSAALQQVADEEVKMTVPPVNRSLAADGADMPNLADEDEPEELTKGSAEEEEAAPEPVEAPQVEADGEEPESILSPAALAGLSPKNEDTFAEADDNLPTTKTLSFDEKNEDHEDGAEEVEEEEEQDPLEAAAEAEMHEYSVRRKIATKVLGAKVLQGYTLKEETCEKCHMPLMELDGDIACAVCPVLMKQVKKNLKRIEQEKALHARIELQASTERELENWANEALSLEEEEVVEVPEAPLEEPHLDEEALSEHEAEFADDGKVSKHAPPVDPPDIDVLTQELSEDAKLELLRHEARIAAELKAAEEARMEAEREAIELADQKKALDEALMIEKLETEAKDKARQAEEAIQKAKAALALVAEARKEIIAKTIAAGEQDAIAEAEGIVEADTVAVHAAGESDPAEAQRAHWEALRTEGLSAMTRCLLQGWTMMPKLCLGTECGNPPLITLDGKVACVVCGGSGSGLDGAYIGYTAIAGDITDEQAIHQGVPMDSVAARVTSDNPVQGVPSSLSEASDSVPRGPPKTSAELNEDFETRRNQVSKEIGKRMAEGWMLLDLSCPVCVMPLMSRDNADGSETCVLCGPMPNGELPPPPPDDDATEKDEMALTRDPSGMEIVLSASGGNMKVMSRLHESEEDIAYEKNNPTSPSNTSTPMAQESESPAHDKQPPPSPGVMAQSSPRRPPRSPRSPRPVAPLTESDDHSAVSEMSATSTVAMDALDAIAQRMETCRTKLLDGTPAEQAESAVLLEKLASAAVALKKLESVA